MNPGDILDGKYVVERVLGAGGMGMVVAARHVDLGRHVAVKFMLREAMNDPNNVDRFKREARAAVQLKSVHTARVIDVGQLVNGEPYMVMEYLEGQDLDEVIQVNGALPLHTAVDYILQAIEAIAEAHGLGMIHRDIKLKNLFLTRSVDGSPLVKVLDFGLAKNLGGSTDVSLTATTAVFGSPQYMSPEQMRSAKDADRRSDVWSLGVCLYELLTGRLPFDAPGVAEICAMVLKDPVPPPRQVRPDLPPQLEDVVMRALAKDPAKRFQSVAELAMALEPFAFEGSGRRILAVMETASRPSLTVARSGQLLSPDEIVKTISSWDSGEQARRAGGANRVLGALIGIGMAAVIMLAAFGGYVFYRHRAGPTAANASANASASASDLLAPPALPPTQDPVATPTTALTASTSAPASDVSTPEPAPSEPAAAVGTAAKPSATHRPQRHPPTPKPAAATPAKTAPQPATTSTQKKTWDSP